MARSGFFERLDRRLNPDLYRDARPPSASENSAPPPTFAPEPTYSEPPMPFPVLQPPISQVTSPATPRYSYAPQTFQARTIEIPVQTTSTPTYSYSPQPIQAPTYSYAPQPFRAPTYSYAPPQTFQARTIEIPVQNSATPTYSYAPQPIQYQQPPVQTIQYQQPVQMIQQPPVQTIQYQQPQPQVQVVEKPVVQYVDKYVRPPAPPPQVVHHTEVRLVPGRNGRLAQGFGYGGATGYEYGLGLDDAYGYPGNDFAYSGAPQYAMPSMYSDYPRHGDPAIPPPSRFPVDPSAGAPFTPYRGGGGMVTPRSAKRSLAYGGGRESAYRWDL
jgi:hypothetical protein